MFEFRLKVFHSVAKRLSFTKAAAELFITQPAVTKHIKELEQHFRVQLFERQGNRIRLTRQGEVMLQYSEQLFSIYRKMEFDLNSFSEQHKGLLNVGASSTVSQYVIPRTLAAFHKQYSDVVVRLMNGNTEQIEHALLNNDIDLGIIEGKSRTKGIRYTRFLKDEIVLVANTSNTVSRKPFITVDELKKIPLLIRERGSGTLDVITHAFKQLNVAFSQLKIEMELGSTEAIKSYLRNSDCMAFLSVHSVLTEIDNNSLRIIDIDGLRIERYFYFSERQGTSERLANVFMSFANAIT